MTDKLLQHNPATLERKVRSAAEALVDVDAATSMMVTIYNGAGAVVAGPTAATKTTTGTYQYVAASTLTATLDQYRVPWEWTQDVSAHKATSYYEVVGAYYFSLAEARELAGMTTPTAQQITDARERIEELIESKCGVAFVPRGRRAVFYGRGHQSLSLGDWFVREIYSLSILDGAVTTAYGVSELADLAFGSRQLFRKDGTAFPWGSRNISSHYAYGMSEPPEPVKRAALLMCQASFILTDSEGNPIRPLSSVLTDIPEVQELLEPYIHTNSAYSIQVGTG